MAHFQTPAFALPFVTRSLRGGRKRRYMLLSAAFSALTLIVGLWLALGTGPFERAMRNGLQLEAHAHERSLQTRTLEYHDELDFHGLRGARDAFVDRFGEDDAEIGRRIRAGELSNERGWTQVHGFVREGYDALDAVLNSHPTSPADEALRQRVAAHLQVRVPDPRTLQWDYGFAFHDATSVAHVDAILDHGLVPRVRAYSSPLGLGGALMLVGVFSAGLLSLLLLVVAPIAVGVQQAQEVNENTLMPLGGTALSPLELTAGLMCGPLSVIAIFAAPHAGLSLITATVAGHPFLALAMLLTGVAGMLFLSTLAQLLGHTLGRERTPGIVGVSTLMFLGMLWCIGAAVGLELDRDLAGAVAVLPQAATLHLLQATFVPEAVHASADPLWVGLGIGLGAFAGLALGWVMLQAIAHKTGARPGPTLTRGQAVVAAVVGTAMLAYALAPTLHLSSGHGHRALYLGTLGLLAGPYALLAMGRVYLSDAPPSMRTMDLRRVGREFATFFLIHAIVVTTAGGPGVLATVLNPITAMYLLWCGVTLLLFAVRVVALAENGWATNLARGASIGIMLLGFGQACMWAGEPALGAADVFVLSRISPVLGLVQAAVTIALPVALYRSLRFSLAGLDRDPSR